MTTTDTAKWPATLVEIYELHRDTLVKSGIDSARADDVVDKMTDIDVEVQAHIKRNLAKIPHHEHEAVIAEYLRIASLPREIGDNMTAQARANVWLYDRANDKKLTE